MLSYRNIYLIDLKFNKTYQKVIKHSVTLLDINYSYILYQYKKINQF